MTGTLMTTDHTVATTDETLLELARGGDRSAREELFRRHFDVSYRVAHRLLGHEQDAKDAVQDGYVKALSAFDTCDGRSGFRAWLLRVVANAALDFGRKRRRRDKLRLLSFDRETARDSKIDESDPARGLEREDLRKTLDAALDRLGPEKRATFVLYAEAGLSYKEIAECQRVPLGTVMSRISDARRKLQAILEGFDAD